jgi:type I restriction enzyme M protein
MGSPTRTISNSSTFLLFLKMADERARLTGEEQPIPAGHRWADLAAPQMEGVELEQHYRETLRTLGQQGGMLGLIFEKAQNRIQDPAKLRQLVVELIGRENWSAMSADVKGRRLRGAARAPRAGREGRCWAVLHATPRHRGDRRLRASSAR